MTTDPDECTAPRITRPAEADRLSQRLGIPMKYPHEGSDPARGAHTTTERNTARAASV
jgi:hypothetical protein